VPARAQSQASPAGSTTVNDIRLTAARDIADASTVNEAISVMVKDVSSCRSSASKDAQTCACSFKDDLKKLSSAYDAALTKHSAWGAPATVVSYVDPANGKSVALNFPSIKRQIEACADLGSMMLPSFTSQRRISLLDSYFRGDMYGDIRPTLSRLIAASFRASFSIGLPFLFVSLLWATAGYGAVQHVPIQPRFVLKPNESFVVSVNTAVPMEIGWLTVQSKSCTADCIEMTELSAGTNFSVTTRLGASKQFMPTSGKISLKFKNVSREPVTLDVFQVKRTCDAEACQFLDESRKTRWLVFKVGEFKSITTSKDESYSVISGIAMSGRPFRFRAVWWTDEKGPPIVDCTPSVKKYLESHTPKEEYRPYVISGQAIGGGTDIVLRSISTCAPKAPGFGVPEENVYK
jgi:hypothetical protein